MRNERPKVCMNVYLFLQREGKILFSLRQNTGYEDGRYSLVAGHVESGESATQAMVREAREEIGISIFEKDLKVIHTMHRKTNRDNIDLFLLCSQWSGAIENQEPGKCGDLSFYSIAAPPQNIIPYIQHAIDCMINGIPYSELGFES